MTGSVGKPGARNSGGGTCEQGLRLLMLHFAACAQGHAQAAVRGVRACCSSSASMASSATGGRTRSRTCPAARCSAGHEPKTNNALDRTGKHIISPTTGWRGNAAPIF
ncbi:unnamed protein product [Urochloa humidicola]